MERVAQANRVAAEALVDELARAGVANACVCPGSRSTPLVLALAAHDRIHVWMVTDERAAGYFALGMARTSGRAVAVVCTSGTAAANLVPAAAEAALSEVPLVLLTADRPPELRDCAAAQTIAQRDLFSGHARWCHELATPTADVDLEAYYRSVACRAVATAESAPAGPVHLNLPLREPLIEQAAAASSVGSGRQGGRAWTEVHRPADAVAPVVLDGFASSFASVERGLIVCGPRTAGVAGAAESAAAVTELARRLAWPILADPLSGLRYGRHDLGYIVDAYDTLLRDETFARTSRPDVVLRLGAPPVSKALNTFLATTPGASQVLLASPGSWPDPSFSVSDVVRADAVTFCTGLAGRLDEKPASGWLEAWRQRGASARATIERELDRTDDLFEGRIARETLACLPEGALLCVGNSMPIRDIDTFTGCAPKLVNVTANRGANGIDGVLSAALGCAAVSSAPVALVVGDLSFLHDLGALQIAERHQLDLVVVLVNNDGGGIFSFLPQAGLDAELERFFVTPHGLDAAPAVQMCGGCFTRVTSWHELRRALHDALDRRGLSVVEVPTDRELNVRRHRELVALAMSPAKPGSEAAA